LFNVGHVLKTKHNLSSVHKLVKKISKDKLRISFCDVFILIMVIFEYMYFTR